MQKKAKSVLDRFNTDKKSLKISWEGLSLRINSAASPLTPESCLRSWNTVVNAGMTALDESRSFFWYMDRALRVARGISPRWDPRCSMILMSWSSDASFWRFLKARRYASWQDSRESWHDSRDDTNQPTTSDTNCKDEATFEDISHKALHFFTCSSPSLLAKAAMVSMIVSRALVALIFFDLASSRRPVKCVRGLDS